MFRKRVSRKDFKKCRLCLCNNGMLMYLFEASGVLTNVAKAISEVLQYKVSEDDRFPPYICSACSDKLWEFKAFKQKCDSAKEAFESFLSRRDKRGTNPEDPFLVNAIFVKKERPVEVPSVNALTSRGRVPDQKNAKGTKRKFKVFVESVAVEADDSPEKSNHAERKLGNKRFAKVRNGPMNIKEEMGIFCTEEDAREEETDDGPVLSNLLSPADEEEVPEAAANNFQVFAESIAVENIADNDENEESVQNWDDGCYNEITVSPVKMEIEEGEIQGKDKLQSEPRESVLPNDTTTVPVVGASEGLSATSLLTEEPAEQVEVFPVKLGLYSPPAPVIPQDFSPERPITEDISILPGVTNPQKLLRLEGGRLVGRPSSGIPADLGAVRNTRTCSKIAAVVKVINGQSCKTIINSAASLEELIIEDRIDKPQAVEKEVKKEEASPCKRLRPEKLMPLLQRLISSKPLYSSETPDPSSEKQTSPLATPLSLCPMTGNFISLGGGVESKPNVMPSEATDAALKDSILMKLLSTDNDEESTQDVAANLQGTTSRSQASNSSAGVAKDVNGQCSKTFTNPTAPAEEATAPTVQNSILMQLLLNGKKDDDKRAMDPTAYSWNHR